MDCDKTTWEKYFTRLQEIEREEKAISERLKTVGMWSPEGKVLIAKGHKLEYEKQGPCDPVYLKYMETKPLTQSQFNSLPDFLKDEYTRNETVIPVAKVFSRQDQEDKAVPASTKVTYTRSTKSGGARRRKSHHRNTKRRRSTRRRR